MLLCDADYSPEFGLQLKPPALKVPRREFLGGAFLKLTPRQKDDSHCGNLHLFHITTSAEITISTLPLRNGLNLAQQGPNLGPTSTCIAWLQLRVHLGRPGPTLSPTWPTGSDLGRSFGPKLGPCGGRPAQAGPNRPILPTQCNMPIISATMGNFPPVRLFTVHTTIRPNVSPNLSKLRHAGPQFGQSWAQVGAMGQVARVRRKLGPSWGSCSAWLKAKDGQVWHQLA